MTVEINLFCLCTYTTTNSITELKQRLCTSGAIRLQLIMRKLNAEVTTAVAVLHFQSTPVKDLHNEDWGRLLKGSCIICESWSTLMLKAKFSAIMSLLKYSRFCQKTSVVKMTHWFKIGIGWAIMRFYKYTCRHCTSAR